MKITADLKCLSCGRIWATAQDDMKARFVESELRTAHPELLPVTGGRVRRCPRCQGTLWLEWTDPVEYEADLLIGG
jgi:hypothetical protein